ncbi:MAG: phosphatidylinositol-specific phospholipase C1-like protein [Pseudomonadales bacterium]
MNYQFQLSRAIVLVLLPLLTQCEILTGHARNSLKLNEIQIIGSHNSYKKPMDPALMAQLAADNPQTAASLEYSHRPLAEQLDLGLRKLELDIFYDPQGGRYASPLGTRAIASARPFDPDGVMERPGFKVLHVQDIDFRSHCLTFRDCLGQIVTWSDANPEHLPIFITINAKDDVIDRPGFVKPLEFTGLAWDALDAEIRSVVGEKLLVPDQVRGQHESLRAAVLDGWPTLVEVRGRILFVLDDSTAKKQAYVKDHPSLAGRVLFVDAPEDSPEASIRIVNDPLQQENYIQELVRQGFIVRTRSDANTSEARTGDKSRFDAALRSGAQIISTDYYSRDEKFGKDFLIALPGKVVARCNPVLVATPCSLSAFAN